MYVLLCSVIKYLLMFYGLLRFCTSNNNKSGVQYKIRSEIITSFFERSGEYGRTTWTSRRTARWRFWRWTTRRIWRRTASRWFWRTTTSQTSAPQTTVSRRLYERMSVYACCTYGCSGCSGCGCCCVYLSLIKSSCVEFDAWHSLFFILIRSIFGYNRFRYGCGAELLSYRNGF